MTQADWQALQAAGAAGGTGYLESLHAQQQQMLTGTGVTLGGQPGAPATSTSGAVGQNALDTINTNFPELAWLLNVPGLGDSIVSWASQGYTDAQAQAAFEASGFFQTHGDKLRRWITEVMQDPATAQSDLQAQISVIRATTDQLGVMATDQQLQQFAQQSLALGWTDQQIKDEISSNLQGNGPGQWVWNYGGQKSQASGGNLQAAESAVQAAAAKFLVPVSDFTSSSMAMKLVGGQLDSTALDAYFQQQAIALYPTLKQSIANGVSPAEYASAYQETAAQLLGVDPKAINMADPKWSVALHPAPGQEKSANPTTMSLYAWQQYLMQNHQYGYMNSVNAKDRASSIAQGLGEMFGKAPSGPAGSTAFSAAGAPRIAGVPIA